MSCASGPPKFTVTSPAVLRASLAGQLRPVADSLRDLLTQFGLRPYKVSILRVRWTGLTRGEGQAQVVSELVLLPTPKVVSIENLEAVLSPIGVNETGTLELVQISTSYTEEQLRGLTARGEAIPANEEVLYEIEFQRLDGGGPLEKRRFTLASAPEYKPGAFQWAVRLERARGGRARNEDLE